MDFTGKKRVALYIVISAIVFSVAAVVLSYMVCNGGSKQNSIDLEIFGAVPIDASAVLYFADSGELNNKTKEGGSFFSDIFFSRGEMGFLAEKKYKKGPIVVSAHYSAHNSVSLLFSVWVQDSYESFIESQFNEARFIRSYNGVKVYKWKGISMAVLNGYFVASVSDIVMESSLRHISSGISIAQNSDFLPLVNNGNNSGVMIFLNHKQAGKLFSAFVARKYLGYADFVSRFSDWTLFNVTSKGPLIATEGSFNNTSGAENLVSLFNNINPSEHEIISFVPATTRVLLSVSVDNLFTYADSFRKFKEYHKYRQRADIWESALRWLESLDAREVACAYINYAGETEPVTVIRTGKNPGSYISEMFMGDKEQNTVEFNKKGYVRSLFGDFFSETPEDYMLKIGDFVLIGSFNILEQFSRGAFSSFSMREYIEQTKAHNLLPKGKDMVSLIVNASEDKKKIADYFNGNTNNIVRDVLSTKNMVLFAFKVSSRDGLYAAPVLYAYADSIEKTPEPQSGRYYDIPGWENDTVVPVPKGPFTLVNFNNREVEYLEQLDSKWLRLSDKNMEGLWAIPFLSDIKGFVQQVDFFGNGKLQMMFASDKSLFLLDRTGRYVSPFPVATDYPVELGPKVYDIGDDGDYAVMLLHSDNKLRLYDSNGRVQKKWKNISLPETIKEFPELIDVDGSKYWLLRTMRRACFYHLDGTPVFEQEDQIRIRPDSSVESLEDSKVKVKNTEGKFLLINLVTGAVKEVRK